MGHLLVQGPSKSEKIFKNEQASIWLAGGVFHQGQGRVLTAPSKAALRVRSWGFVSGVGVLCHSFSRLAGVGRCSWLLLWYVSGTLTFRDNMML